MRMTRGPMERTLRWALGLAAWVVVVGGVTACTGPQASVPQAAPPAAPDRPQQPPPGSPVVADEHQPSCQEYTAWVNDPEVSAALAKTALWPEVIAEAEKAAASEPVDTGHVQQLFGQLAKVARPLSQHVLAATNPETTELAAHALGLSARLVERLERNELDQVAAGAALTELKQAIAAYEAQAAAEETRCGSPDGDASPSSGS